MRLSSRSRAALDEALSGLRGAGPLTEEDRKRQRVAEACENKESQRAGKVRGARGAKVRAQHALDVGLLAERRAAELVDLARMFLVEERGCGARRRFQISSEEGDALWDAWSGSREGDEGDGAGRARSLGAVLHSIERRATGDASRLEDEAQADVEEKLGREFCIYDLSIIHI